MTADDSCVIVVRAWRDRGRTIIRVLAGADDPRSADQWVFSDVDDACREIATLIKGLGTEVAHDTKR